MKELIRTALIYFSTLIGLFFTAACLEFIK
jgi:hypothetical protein